MFKKSVLLMVFLAMGVSPAQEPVVQSNPRIFSLVQGLVWSLISALQSLISASPAPQEIINVRQADSDALCFPEIEYLATRSAITTEALSQLINRPLTPEQAPRIALCVSGGGFRAMIATLGLLKGAQEIKLLDSISYMSGLSGSTWAFAPWIASGKTLDQYIDTLGAKISYGLQPIIHPVDTDVIMKKLVSRVTSGQSISAIDLYGDLLANILLADLGRNRLSATLADTHKKVANGDYPLPIYTAVTINVDPYEWFECTPFEMGSSYTKSYIPVGAYGRIFNEGVSKINAPALSLGYMMGVYGSAFDVAVADLVRMMGEGLNQNISQYPYLVQLALQKLLGILVDGDPTDDTRIFPSKMPNYIYKYGDHVLKDKKNLTLVDAGIDFNLPFPPLLRKGRNVDIIIVYDASADNKDFDTLKAAKAYSIRKKLPFPEINYHGLDKELVRVFQDVRDPRAPVIIYFPMTKNAAYSTTFDPVRECEKGYCSTYNFTYSQKQIYELSGLVAHTIVQHADLIKQVIADVVTRKAECLSA